MPEKPPIGVIGVGWVGLVSGACFAELGHHVWLRDIDAAKIAALARGDVPIYEPGLKEIVARNAERLHFEDQLGPLLEHARLLFVCVDTPPTYSGDADLSRVEAVVDELPSSSEHAIVMKSTVPVGTGANVKRRLGELGKGDLGYASNPEFLKEGSAVDDFMHPDRVVVGADAGNDWVGDAVDALYQPLEGPVVRTDVASAEMIKLASNAFLATKISFINEIANVCEEVGADVSEVAAGMGLDPRIGQSFLNAGIGFGGSCLAGDETVLVRQKGTVRLISFEALYRELETQAVVDSTGAAFVSPSELEVLSWQAGEPAPEFRPVNAVTRRPFAGEIVELRTKMGRRLRSTPDHPFVVSDGDGGRAEVKRAAELTDDDWLPVSQNAAANQTADLPVLNVISAATDAGIAPAELIVRPPNAEIAAVASKPAGERNVVLDHPRGSRIRLYDVVRSGALRLDEALALGVSTDDSAIGTAKNGTYMPAWLTAVEAFWRVVGLYIAEGHCTVDGRRHRLQWSFHPTDEEDLVDEVVAFWSDLGVKASVFRHPTTTAVVISSRVLASLWFDVLGLGKNCYEQRIPDLAWAQSESAKKALLAGLWRGDGSWSRVAGGPSVVLEFGSVSRELIDGVLRLLGELGVVARLKVGRTKKSTQDNYWLVVSGAEQVERLLDLVPECDRGTIRASLAAQAKRIAPTGYRRHSDNAAWVRVTDKLRHAFDGFVYSLEVPGTETFVTTGGLVVHNCFPKDVSALKQLAGNSGYHFQLLTAVIEVNELQKRRVVSKLKRHLDSLIGKRIALLGLAFKPNTDDMREASSVVLAARLQAEGAIVRAYDPVAEDRASEMLTGVQMCDTALECIQGADAAVIVTEWAEFGELDLTEMKNRMANPIVVDGRNMLNARAVQAAGLIYEGIGRA